MNKKIGFIGCGKMASAIIGGVLASNYLSKENIVATYSGGDYNQEYFPTKILIFDLTGNYIKTLDVGYKISDCCYDETNNRIVMAFDDEIQFGYLNLNTLM